ncbi:hypothetical protein LB504_008115 [Fusarium proliferatum]|nr:hypothetical protein LB504_008115 [Fusarium proliferatum]
MNYSVAVMCGWIILGAVHFAFVGRKNDCLAQWACIKRVPFLFKVMEEISRVSAQFILTYLYTSIKI